jgi:hypothetical protein
MSFPGSELNIAETSDGIGKNRSVEVDPKEQQRPKNQKTTFSGKNSFTSGR